MTVASDLEAVGATGAPAARATFRDIAEHWFASRRNLKKTSLDKYVTMLRAQIYPWLGEKDVLTLTTEDLTSYVWALDAVGYAPGTIRFAFTTVKAILDHAVRCRLIGDNPARHVHARDRPRLKRRNTRSLTTNEIIELLNAAREPYKTIFALAIFAALRSGEIRGLQWLDIDLKSNRIHVRRQAQHHQLVAPKTDNAYRQVALLEPLPAILTNWKHLQAETHPDALLFSARGQPLLAPRLLYTLRQTAIRAKVDSPPDEAPLRFHDLRHSAASIMIASGADITFVARQLGHATPATTLATYAHLFDEVANIDRVRSYVSTQFVALAALPS